VNPVTVPLTGNVMPRAIYTVALAIGSPPQIIPDVALDTGSPDLLIPLTTCSGCGNFTSSGYNSAASSTSTQPGCPRSPCPWSVTYETCVYGHPTQPCTAGGSVFKDNVNLNSPDGPSVVGYSFNGMNRVRPVSNTQLQTSGGIWGIGNAAGNSFLAVYTKANGWSNMFSFCLQQSGGWLTVGGINSSFVASGATIAYGPILTAPITTRVDSFDFNGAPAINLTGSVIVDSGTNVTLLNTKQYNTYYNLFSGLCNSNSLVGICGMPRTQSLFSGACFNMTDDDVSAFPNIGFTVAGTPLIIPPQYYLFVYQGQRCLGLNAGNGGEGFVLIGDTWLRPLITVINYSTHKIGFAQGTNLCTGGGDV